jgi:hypothetical protein
LWKCIEPVCGPAAPTYSALTISSQSFQHIDEMRENMCSSDPFFGQSTKHKVTKTSGEYGIVHARTRDDATANDERRTVANAAGGDDVGTMLRPPKHT